MFGSADSPGRSTPGDTILQVLFTLLDTTFYMTLIAYAHNHEDAQVIEQFFKINNNLEPLNFNLNEEEKPTRLEVEEGCSIVLNDENTEIKHRTYNEAQNYDNFVIRINRTRIGLIEELIQTANTIIHLPDTGISLHSINDISSELLELIAPHSNGDVLQIHRGGRAPLGCRIEDDYLVKAEDFERVRETLMQHVEDSISEEEAAAKLETTKRTIQRARERDDLYRLR
jgi:hypothetical protein